MNRKHRLSLFSLPSLAALAAGIAACGAAPDASDEETQDANLALLDTGAGVIPVSYEVKSGRAVIEGDILLRDDTELRGELATRSVGVANATRRYSIGSAWPTGIVYYRYDSTVGAALKGTIQSAIAHYHQRTTLIWVEDTAQNQPTFVRFTSPSGSTTCQSDIGYPGANKVVTTELGNGCNSFDTVVHEMGHAIGLRHEHTRADRDNFISINTANLRPGKAANFTKWPVTEGLLTDYDFDSVMHYNSTVTDAAFVYDTSKPVFTRKDGSLIVAQDGSGLSDGDVRGIQEMYGSEFEPVASTVAWSSNRLDTFVRGTDGQLFHKAWEGARWYPSASGYEALGGYMVGSPEAVSWGANRIDVFVRGGDRALYHKAWDGSGWYPSATGFENLGGSLASHPSAVSSGVNRLDVFAKGDDGQVFQKSWNGAAWGGWNALGGYSEGPVKAVSWGPNRIDLFTIGVDHGVYHKAWDGSAWYPSTSGWEALGGIAYGVPAVTAWSSDRLDIVVKGQNGALFHKAWDGRGWYPSVAGWEDLGGRFIGNPAMTAWGANRLDIVGQGLDGQLFHKAWNGSAWYPGVTGWEPLGGALVGSPTIASWGPNRLDVFARGMDDALFHKAWNGSAWSPSATGWEGLGGRLAW